MNRLLVTTAKMVAVGLLGIALGCQSDESEFEENLRKIAGKETRELSLMKDTISLMVEKFRNATPEVQKKMLEQSRMDLQAAQKKRSGDLVPSVKK